MNLQIQKQFSFKVCEALKPFYTTAGKASTSTASVSAVQLLLEFSYAWYQLSEVLGIRQQQHQKPRFRVIHGPKQAELSINMNHQS